MNPYEILGVEPSATDAQIRKAYRDHSKDLHPDNQETGDEEKFKEVKEAYDVLSDKERRKRYDDTGETRKSPVTPQVIRNVMSEMIRNVIHHERVDGSTDNPDWDDIKTKIIMSIKASRREVVVNIKNAEKKLRRTEKLAKRFKPKQDHDPIGEIFKEVIEGMNDQLKSFNDALELSLETQKAFEEYDYEVGPDPEGHFRSEPTLRLGGSRYSDVIPPFR